MIILVYFHFLLKTFKDIKEWSVFCIRNLTEGNEENQKEIEKFKPVDIDPATKSILKKMGRDVELVDDKLKIKKVDF
jgi:hypothetical protein